MGISSSGDDISKLLSDPQVVADRLASLKRAKEEADAAVRRAGLAGDIENLQKLAALARAEANDYAAAKRVEADSYLTESRRRADAMKAEAARLIEAATAESTSLAERTVAEAQAKALAILAEAGLARRRAEDEIKIVDAARADLAAQRVTAFDDARAMVAQANELKARAEAETANAAGLKQDLERRLALLRAAGV